MSLSDLFMSPALAQGVAPAAEGGSTLMSIAPLLLIFVIFYFLVLRPQSKKIKLHQEMLNALKAGDKVVTGGGFLGTVVSVNEQDVVVDLGNGVKVHALKHTLSGLQYAPANDAAAK